MTGLTGEALINEAVNSRLKDLHTALPGIIQTFNPVDQTASVQPAIKRMIRTEDGEKEIIVPRSIPLLINVPVVFPAGGGFFLTFPVKVGDECLLIFLERAADTWIDNGGIQKPSAKRFHSYSDAIAIPGLHSRANSIPSYNNDAVELTAGASKVSIVSGITTITGDLQVTGNVLLSGEATIVGGTLLSGGVVVNGVALANGSNIGSDHEHGVIGVQSGGATVLTEGPQ